MTRDKQWGYDETALLCARHLCATMQTTGGSVTFVGLTVSRSLSKAANAVGAAGPSDWSHDAELMVV